MLAEIAFSAKDLVNIRAMCPPDVTATEFDRFIAMCRARGLDPRLGHCYLTIYNAKKAEKRAVITVVSEQGYLAAANRCRDSKGELIYRADDRPPRFTYDEAAKNPATNPLGIVSATVSVWKFLQGEWHEVPAEVFWDERAPILERWKPDPKTGENAPSGEFYIDGKKRGWLTQPRTMLAKCARVAAARYAFPDQLGGLYAEEEGAAIERGKLIDLTATEVIQESIKAEQMKALGADQAIMFDFRDGKGLGYVPLGMIHDRIEAYFLAHPDAKDIQDFCIQNRVGLKEFHAQRAGDLVDLKKRYMDAAAVELKRREAEASQSS